MTTKRFSAQLRNVHNFSQDGSSRQSIATMIPLAPFSEVVLNIHSITRIFPGAGTPAVTQVSFALQKGELLGLLGPSGCGKTTLLRLIAGFDQPQSGNINFDGIEVASAAHCFPPERRGIGMVFQDYALFPHLTVGQNVAFGLKPRRRSVFGFTPSSPRIVRQRVADVLALVGLEGMEGRYPHQLSGGQQQRVSLARALAPKPQMVLLDEPLSNLDAKVRLQLRQDVRDILKAAGATGIFVTHDQEEALSICDRVAVMRCGHLEQIGTPEELYQQPASRFVAEFVVQANFLQADANGEQWDTEVGHFPKTDLAKEWKGLALNYTYSQDNAFDRENAHPGQFHPDHHSHTLDSDGPIDLMIRQEDVKLTHDPSSDIVVRDRQFLGRENRYCLQLPSGYILVARVPSDVLYEVGTKVKVAIAPNTIQVFSHR